MNNTLTQQARQLRLSGLLQTLEVRLEEARSHDLAHDEFLELLLADELNVRGQRGIERRTRSASFRELKTLEDFDFSFNAKIDRRLIYDLAAGNFIDKGDDVLLVGPPGVGKSHLAQAIGYALIKAGKTVLYRSIFDVVAELCAENEHPLRHKEALKAYLACDLLIIDDMGIKVLPPKSGEHLFEIIMRRYEVRSTLMTSNRQELPPQRSRLTTRGHQTQIQSRGEERRRENQGMIKHKPWAPEEEAYGIGVF